MMFSFGNLKLLFSLVLAPEKLAQSLLLFVKVSTNSKSQGIFSSSSKFHLASQRGVNVVYTWISGSHKIFFAVVTCLCTQSDFHPGLLPFLSSFLATKSTRTFLSLLLTQWISSSSFHLLVSLARQVRMTRDRIYLMMRWPKWLLSYQMTWEQADCTFHPI